MRALADWGDKGGYRILDITEHGFVVDVWTHRWVRGLKTGPGYRHVRVAWCERWHEPAFEAHTKTGSLGWAEDVAYQLPRNTSTVAVKARLFNGQEATLLGSGRSSFIGVEYNSSTKQLVIRPVIPGNAGT